MHVRREKEQSKAGLEQEVAHTGAPVGACSWGQVPGLLMASAPTFNTSMSVTEEG